MESCLKIAVWNAGFGSSSCEILSYEPFDHVGVEDGGWQRLFQSDVESVSCAISTSIRILSSIPASGDLSYFLEFFLKQEAGGVLLRIDVRQC